jgi:hypothetical protein
MDIMRSLRSLAVLCLASVGALAWPAAAAESPARTAAVAQKAASAPAGSRCDRLWRRYQRSQACYERHRNANGSIKPEAVQRCGEPLPDPSAECGPAPVAR